jgi:ElaB/YqjD/DUF883 family membrane-anchored ribosome-binding protein
MDVMAVIEKVDKIYSETQTKIERVKGEYNKYAQSVNNVIEEIELTLNEVIAEINAGIAHAAAWAQDKIDTLLQRINDLLDEAESIVNNSLNTVKEKYEITVTNTKLKMVRGLLAKLSLPADEETAQTIIDTVPIPHPTLDSIIPTFDFKAPTINVEEIILSHIGEEPTLAELPRMPYI